MHAADQRQLARCQDTELLSSITETQDRSNIKEPENLDIESITEDRRKAIERTIQVISIEDLKSLGEKLFPFLDHPWRQTFFEFVEEHASDTFYHATTHDQVEIIYCPAKEKGMWFTQGRGMGPLQARGIGILKEIVGKR
jgi:hypothetical protein